MVKKVTENNGRRARDLQRIPFRTITIVGTSVHYKRTSRKCLLFRKARMHKKIITFPNDSLFGIYKEY